MCFEGMEESGSEGLDELIEQEKDQFFKGVDCACISDNYCESKVILLPSRRSADVSCGWIVIGLNTTTPCLTYGLR